MQMGDSGPIAKHFIEEGVLEDRLHFYHVSSTMHASTLQRFIDLGGPFPSADEVCAPVARSLLHYAQPRHVGHPLADLRRRGAVCIPQQQATL